MKLLFTAPHKCDSGDFPSFRMKDAFKGYLQYRNVFIGEHRTDFTISYNNVYGFYDISMFEIAENRDSPAGHIEQTIAVLKEDGAAVEVQGETWRWEGEERIRGKRIWIRAVKEAKDDPAK